jgi:hypothetical protein
LIGKLSRPVELLSNRTITFELSIDFWCGKRYKINYKK